MSGFNFCLLSIASAWLLSPSRPSQEGRHSLALLSKSVTLSPFLARASLSRPSQQGPSPDLSTAASSASLQLRRPLLNPLSLLSCSPSHTHHSCGSPLLSAPPPPSIKNAEMPRSHNAACSSFHARANRFEGSLPIGPC
eukprot:5650378-Pleurochrysis_carterae.AAC.3